MAALTPSKWSSLSILEKIEAVGHHLFTPKQLIVIKAFLTTQEKNIGFNKSGYNFKRLSLNADLSLKSFAVVNASLNRKAQTQISERVTDWFGNAFYTFNEEILNSEFFCFDDLVEAGLIECIEEETQAAQETETETQEEETETEIKELTLSQKIVLLALIECSELMTGGEFGCVKEAHEYQTTLNKNQFNGHLSQKPFNFYLTFDQGCYWLNEDLKTKNIKILLQKLIEEETPAAQGAPKAKRLKASTLKSYDAKALAKHLDKLPSSSYRIDFAYDCIYKEQSDHYLFYCSINHFDRDEITSAIHSVYAEIGI